MMMRGAGTCVYLQALAHVGQQVQHALDGHVAEASSVGTAPNILPPAHMQQLLLSFLHTAMPCFEQHQSTRAVNRQASITVCNTGQQHHARHVHRNLILDIVHIQAAISSPRPIKSHLLCKQSASVL